MLLADAERAWRSLAEQAEPSPGPRPVRRGLAPLSPQAHPYGRSGEQTPPRSSSSWLMLVLIAAGSVVLQREVAETMTGALILSVAWAGSSGSRFLLYARPRGLLPAGASRGSRWAP